LKSAIMADSELEASVERRAFLKAGVALGSALVVNLVFPTRGLAAVEASTRFAPNAFVRIDSQGAVTLVIPMVEMGQGIYTAQAMLLAEELEVGLDQVSVEHAPANDALYANSILHIQTTGLSTSVRAFWLPLRQAGAVARTLLMTAAARRWGVDVKTCRAERGHVLHEASSHSVPYGELVAAAAALPVPRPDSVPLKNPRGFKLIGTPAKRVDTADKVNGRTKYGIDVQLPGLKIAAIAGPAATT
jgi:isoquinoline 1-oxidoreductase beta subunit